MTVAWRYGLVKCTIGLAVAISADLSKQPLVRGAFYGGGIFFAVQAVLEPLLNRMRLEESDRPRRWVLLTEGLGWSIACNMISTILPSTFLANAFGAIGFLGGAFITNRVILLSIWFPNNPPPAPPPIVYIETT